MEQTIRSDHQIIEISDSGCGTLKKAQGDRVACRAETWPVT